MPPSDRFFNRDFSWLMFNERVLEEAMDPSNPLLERLKFMGIVSSNMDEFFMVRVASAVNANEDVEEIYSRAYELIARQYGHFLKVMVPELQDAGIARVSAPALREDQLAYVRNLFTKELFPVLTPIAVPEDRPVPALVNLSLYMVFKLLDAREAPGAHYAVVEIPKNFPRVISLPAESEYRFLLLEDLLSLYAKDLFVGYEIAGAGLMRLTRAAEMTLDEEKDEDFAKVMTEAIRLRSQSPVMRLEISASDEMTAYLKRRLELSDRQVCRVDSWFDLRGISQLALQPAFLDLKRPQWTPRAVPDFENAESVWELLSRKDVCVFHPYETFDVVNRFLAEAADDPDVLAIKQTLYRAGQDSSIITSLEKAAQKGKRVTVLVELKARFDEERNIEWARRLEIAGASVLYGVAGLKTHAKACLVVRREPEGIKRYAHLSTGNYNEKTAKLYSDIGFFTSDETITGDLSAFFNMITGYSLPVQWKKIEVAPYGLRRKLTRLIMREALRSTPEKPGLIMAKMNSLVDPQIIEALYRASKQGVRVKLNVRGICCLRPGVPDLSENIEVTSLVDMFLEHSRIFYFANAGEEEVYLSSADWMPRNLDRRVEILFPVENKALSKELTELLEIYFRDNTKSWKLLPDGKYEKQEAGAEKKFRAQEFLCRRMAEREKQFMKTGPSELKPQKPKSSNTVISS